MSYVITMPTGNVGRKLTELLLESGAEVTIIARDLEKVKNFTAMGAKAFVGSHDNAELLKKATKGAKALFVGTPPDMQMQSITGHYARFGKAAAAAVEANSIPYVVHLSSVGADLESGNGPVEGLYFNEQILNKVAKNIINFRPTYFMENTLIQVSGILQAGSLFTTFPKDTRIPMIATQDISVRIAEKLLNLNWTGTQVEELHGHSEISYEDVAQILTGVLGRPIKHITISDEQLISSLKDMGLSEVLSKGFAELTDALTKGRIRFHDLRSEKSTSPTSYTEFAYKVFKPILEATMAMI